jgi:hypothetical protein
MQVEDLEDWDLEHFYDYGLVARALVKLTYATKLTGPRRHLYARCLHTLVLL